MDFLIVRTYDHAAYYYEIRLMLALLTAGTVLYQWQRKGERRYTVAFVCGSLLYALQEAVWQWLGLRGEGFGISLMGWSVSAGWRPLLQGLVEGGICGSLALWWTDLRTTEARGRAWLGIALVGIGLGILMSIAGYLAKGQPVSSVRPLFSPVPIFVITTSIFASLLLTWRRDGFYPLAAYFGGLLLYSLVTLGPLHLFGARFAAVGPVSDPVAVPPLWEGVLASLSLIFEASGGRLHYFALPFLLGWIPLRKPSHPESDTLSYHQLRTLTERGWRKKSKPFAS